MLEQPGVDVGPDPPVTRRQWQQFNIIFHLLDPFQSLDSSFGFLSYIRANGKAAQGHLVSLHTSAKVVKGGDMIHHVELSDHSSKIQLDLLWTQGRIGRSGNPCVNPKRGKAVDSHDRQLVQRSSKVVPGGGKQY